ncbi:MAG: 3-methyl-2-oxobutanoate hydroxymethyltransferase [Candidatus Sumerlaeaceae bacterium]
MTSPRRAVAEPKRRVHHFAMLKQRGHKIAIVTAYDYPTGVAADSAGCDAVLVGDSLGMVALGYDSTIPVTLDIMVHHTAAVHRGVKRAFLIADLPFLTYQASAEQALLSAGRLVQAGGAEAVKLEGGIEIANSVRAISNAGIPVMGHIGLTPQAVHKLGGYRVQGRQDESAAKLLEDAHALQEAGAFAIVLEAMDPEVATEITASLQVATIGIGAGKGCDGQVLVMTDLIGLSSDVPPKFVKQYASMLETMESAVREFCTDVRSGTFPEQKHEY